MSRNQIRLLFESTTPFAGGKSFGAVGPYERLLGMVSFAIDPDEKDLPFVCDLEFAPRNADGLVEFSAVVDLVKPVDMKKSNRKLLFDFSNRGGRGAFTRLNDGGGDYSKANCAGNGFLNRQGYTVVTAGWQGDLVYTGSNVVAGLAGLLAARIGSDMLLQHRELGADATRFSDVWKLGKAVRGARNVRPQAQTRPACPAIGARRFFLQLLEAADDLERIRLAVEDVAELDERGPAARPAAAGVDQAGSTRNGQPRLIIAVEVAHRDNALRLSGGGGGNGNDGKQDRKRKQREADDPLKPGRYRSLPHAPYCRTGEPRGQWR
jgi:hypothetical protein